MSINNLFNHPVAVASELFSAGWCNLDCQYCYISKVNRIKDIHKIILDKIKSGKFLEELKYYFGEDLESIGHWGTEPTLTIRLFKEFYEKAVEIFPKLKLISLSSNFMTNPDNIVEFARSIPKKLNLDLQISIDGPPEITDKNRRLGSTDKIIENVLYVFKKLNGENRVISVHVKPTASREDIKYLSGFDNLKYYYDFFEDFFGRLSEFKNIKFSNVVNPTVVIPDDYTKEDGINFCQLYKNQIILRENYKYNFISPPESYVYLRAIDRLRSKKEFYSKHRMFVCSAGDSCFAIGERPYAFHYCHRSFYSDDNIYLKEADIGDGEANLKKLVVMYGNSSKTDRLRFLIRPRSYNDFGRLLENFVHSSCYSLAECGMINDVYKEWDMSRMLSFYYLLIGCFIDALVKTGSFFIPDSDLLVLLGNGFGELCTSRLLKESYI